MQPDNKQCGLYRLSRDLARALQHTHPTAHSMTCCNMLFSPLLNSHESRIKIAMLGLPPEFSGTIIHPVYQLQIDILNKFQAFI